MSASIREAACSVPRQVAQQSSTAFGLGSLKHELIRLITG
jgi:hypothetical protein